MNSSTNSENEISAVFGRLSYTRRFSKGSIIYYQGDRAESFYYLKTGKVRVYMTSPDGVEHTLSSAGRGEILGEAAFFDRMPRISSAKALTNIEVAVINEVTLLNLTRNHPRLALELLGLQAARVRQLSNKLDAMTFMKADQRISDVLLQNADEHSEVKLTHEDIAAQTGVTRVTVSKILKGFRDNGLLRTEYGRIRILDPDRLKNQ